jgi:uncharacterized membrane protein
MSHFFQQGYGVLLSHHADDELHLCYRLRVGSRLLHLCARCLGFYPAMAVVLFAGRISAPWPAWLVFGLLFLAPLPALLDWGVHVGLGRKERSNGFRLVTGMGLGVGIGANLVVNMFDLLGDPVIAQLLMFLIYFWFVWVVSYTRRRLGRRPPKRNHLSLFEYIESGDNDGDKK